MGKALRCPICEGMVSPLAYSRETPEKVLDRHIGDMHPEMVREARRQLGLMTKNDMLAELGSAFRLPEEE